MSKYLTIWCVVEGESTSRAFKVKLSSEDDVADLKERIKEKRPNDFAKVDAAKLILWEVVRIIVKPARKVLYHWSVAIDTATVSDLMQTLIPYYPQYEHDDDSVVLYFYKTYSGPSEVLRNDEHLRRILRAGKTKSMHKLIISLATPNKTFSAWTFEDVICEYNLSNSTGVGMEVLPPFTDIQAAPLDSDLEKKVLDHLIHEITCRVKVLKLVPGNDAAKSMVVASFLVAVTTLFEEDLYLASQQNLSGHRGNGPMDFSVHSQKTHWYTLVVTEMKKEKLQEAVTQNMVQLESVLTTKKRDEIDGKEGPLAMRSYGIVTDANYWMLIECTLHEDERVTYRMKGLERTVCYNGKWQDDVRFVFERLVWLWSRMQDELPAHERYSRKTSSAPSVRKTES
ncbi:hypothetical protein BGZ65_002699 [Modicella reniformis]|uniref:Crinkler effector protein N-terminal domain-containing protein n=1 Tax=Modicella reniformis TaxID=1440133 RepID=A0A9P6MKW9_9FUNG|nr:hypothetical protein BGZ65_002699 [Modicella reniformis]